MNFSDLHLISPILRAVEEVGYETPSPIQRKAIPPVLAGQDLLGCAQTGTGKTAAFAMPILQRLAAKQTKGKKNVRALILTPTRELALQIDENIAAYGKYLPLRNCVIFGGVSQGPQVTQLQNGVDILTATPGRLNDLVGQKLLDLSAVEIFVLDEADRMLDMGFVHDVKKVLSHLPKQKQTLLFSATMPKEIVSLANGLLHDPAHVMVTPPSTTVEKIDQSLYYVDKANKRHLLAHLVRQPQVESALVFTRTKHGADRVVRELSKAGIKAMAIHGNKSQNARQDALQKFKDGRIGVLVATDIAARGIDVSGLTHVFNYDLPNMPETYVHRIGRTGRAGQAGIAISFCCVDELAYVADIQKEIGLQIPTVEHNWPMQVMESIPVIKQQGRRAKAQQQPAAAQQGEKKTMEETVKKPAAAPAAEGDAAKKRRRRGGRRHNKNKEQAGGTQAAVQAESAPQQKPAQKKPAPKAAAAAKQPQTAKTPQKQQKAAPAPAPVAKQAKSEKPAAKKPQQAEVDDSIQVISRRAPAQKFASFEEYMKAHE